MLNAKQTGDSKYIFLRRVFGRSTIFLIISLLLVAGWQFVHPAKVIVERQVETSRELTFKRKPSLSNLLSWSQDLNLSAAQEESLRQLLSEEQIKLKPVEKEISKATQEFNEFASKHAGGPASFKDLRTVAQPISELSRNKRRIEQGFAARGLEILDEGQKKKARQLWEAQLARLIDRKKEVANP